MRTTVAASLLVLAACRGGSPTSPTAVPASAEAVRSIALVPTPASLPVGGGSTEIVIATSPATHATVTLTASAGSLSADSAETDFTGHARVTWTGETTATISAAVGSVTASVAIAVEVPAPTIPPSKPRPPAPGPNPLPPPLPLPPDYQPPAPITVTISNTDPSVAAITFTATITSDLPPASVSYAWAFGDGVSSTAGPTVTHTYAKPGSYLVTLTVTASDGRVATTTLPIVQG